MATQSALYRAPFQSGGTTEIDAALAQKLLAVALSKGGDYADLFFEYRAAGGLVFDEGILKSASRGVVLGLGSMGLGVAATSVVVSHHPGGVPDVLMVLLIWLMIAVINVAHSQRR